MIDSKSRFSLRQVVQRVWRIIVPLTINAIIVASATLVLIAPIKNSPNTLALAVGDVSTVDITAPHSITYITQIQTNAARATAIASVQDIYDPPDSRIARQQIARVRQVMEFISSTRADAFAKVQQKINDFNAITDFVVDASMATKLLNLSDAEWLAVQNETASVIERALSAQIRADRVQESKNRVSALVSINLSESQAELVTKLATPYIVPNSLVNQAATKAARDAAGESVTPISQSFVKDQIVVNRGRVITQADVEALNAFNLLAPEQRWQTITSNALAILISAALFGVYLSRFKSSYFSSARLMIYFGSIFVLFLIGARFMVPGRTVLPFLFPSAAFSMLVVVTLGPNVAILASVIIAALVGVLAEGRLDVTIYVAMGGIVAALMLGRAERLNSFFWAGLAAAAANCGIVLVFRMADPNSDVFGIGTLLAASLINGALSASATLAIFFILGYVFDITTSIQLIELARPNHPLLQLMLREAPGTYQHSLQVANLAEQAAERIGANTTLVRVGALFHDVGKALHPEYFVENQITHENPHDTLPPEVSARYIINHVTDGLKLAAKYRLPSVIRACIAEHHGDSITYFQYQRALKAENNDDKKITKEDFRYPGPKPQTKETALLMLADGCEAKSRSDLPRTVEDIEKIVKFIFDLRLSTGQLDECSLTMHDIRLTQVSFVETLKGFFHSRLKYPEEILPKASAEEVLERN